VTPHPPKQGIYFDEYRFDLETGRLWRAADEVRLTPKAAAVLVELVTHAGEPVSRDHLFTTVWKDTAVGDDALTSCIQELRRALDDDPRQPRYIETRHRRGYRFVAALAAVTSRAATATPVPAAPAQPAQDISAIAVLPFADMSQGRDQDYLCDGFADELINVLTHIDGLRVASRTASFQFRNRGADVQEIGRHLGVGTLLEGSVRKAGDQLRVTVQLIEVATGYHRWSQRFDRRLDDVFGIQDEIATSVAASLRGVVPTLAEKKAMLRPQTGAAAYECYLRGLQHLPRLTRADLETSRDMFQKALELDAAYEPAWAGLATVHATLYEWFGSQVEDLDQAERASRRALELGPGLAEAHVARGCALSLSRRYREAAGEFEEAIRLNANLFDACYYFARASFAAGDIARSAELFHRAADVSRQDFQSPILEAQSLRMLGRMTEAAEATREGIARAERRLALNPIDGRALSLGSAALFHDGQVVRAMEWSRRSLELHPDDMGTLLSAACLYFKRGQKEEGLDLLERVFARGWGKRDWVAHDPDYDIVRDHPRFKALIAGLK
jgi:TolB-like protein/tetratricopeptide (TPR) repeat protein